MTDRHTTNTTPATPLTPEIVSAILRDPDSPLHPAQITVFCDHCGTENTGDYLVSAEMSSRERLAVARKHLVEHEGWEHTDDGDDFCPEHAGSSASDDDGLCESEFPGDGMHAGQLCTLPAGHRGAHQCNAAIAGSPYRRTLAWI